MDLIKLREAIKLYEADKNGMKKGKEIESHGKEERKAFLFKYPIESIPNLTIEQYALGDNSFSHWLLYKLRNIASPGNTYISDFGIYTKKGSSDILLSNTKSYKKQFGSDYKNAFIYLKNEIVNFLKDVEQKNYNDLENYRINSKVKNRLMVVYFYDRFVPVCTNNIIDECLNNLNIPFEKKAPMVDKNLTLVEWKKTVPELADWSNQIVLDFGRRWINTQILEKAQKIEEEISCLNVEGASKKAIINVRVNQGIFRDLLLKRYNRCCLCGMENHTLLIASHIKPWAKSRPEEKLDVDNVFLMCPNHDKLFDKGYITFDNNGKIIISGKLAENDKIFLNVDSKMQIELNKNNKKYLKFHRENVFNR